MSGRVIRNGTTSVTTKLTRGINNYDMIFTGLMRLTVTHLLRHLARVLSLSLVITGKPTISARNGCVICVVDVGPFFFVMGGFTGPERHGPGTLSLSHNRKASFALGYRAR